MLKRTLNILRARLGVRAEQLHSDQSGAVALLCLAACLILLMLSLIIYDTGMMSRDKVDAQMAADTSAYSQAAVKARSMNMTSMANVGKRTVMGIRNMYYYQYPMYMQWLSGQCSRCCCGFWCGCWGACFNCWGNWISLVPIFEGLDYAFFMLGRFTGDRITAQLREFDTFQKELKDYTGYWAASEGVIRGARNGASFIGTFPQPDNRDYGKLPTKKSSGFFAPIEACLAPTFVFNPVTTGTIAPVMGEWDINFKMLKRNSVSSPNIASKGPREVVRKSYSMMGCMDPLTLIGIARDSRPSIPYFLTATGESGRDYLKKSHFVFSYHANSQYADMLHNNYDGIIGSYDYKETNSMWRPEGGVWSMARGEFVYKEDTEPIVLTGGPNGFFLFHPGWTGRLRPVALPGEDIPVDTKDMWSEAGGITDMFRQGMFFGADTGKVWQDSMYMRRVMRGLTGKIQGKEVLDGIPK